MEYRAGFVAGNNVAKDNLMRLLLISTVALLCVTGYTVFTCEPFDEKFFCTFSVWVAILACNVVVKKIHEPVPLPLDVKNSGHDSYREDRPSAEHLTTVEHLQSAEHDTKQPPGYEENTPLSIDKLEEKKVMKPLTAKKGW